MFVNPLVFCQTINLALWSSVVQVLSTSVPVSELLLHPYLLFIFLLPFLRSSMCCCHCFHRWYRTCIACFCGLCSSIFWCSFIYYSKSSLQWFGCFLLLHLLHRYLYCNCVSDCLLLSLWCFPGSCLTLLFLLTVFSVRWPMYSWCAAVLLLFFHITYKPLHFIFSSRCSHLMRSNVTCLALVTYLYSE